MKISIQTLGGKSIILLKYSNALTEILLDVESDITIHQLKARIEIAEGVPIETQRLIFLGKYLEDGKL